MISLISDGNFLSARHFHKILYHQTILNPTKKMYCQSGLFHNYGYVKKSYLTQTFAGCFGHDDTCLKLLSVQNISQLLTTATCMELNLKYNFLCNFVYLNNYHTYAVFCLFLSIAYFKKLLNELVGKYSPSEKVFTNLNKYCR